MILRSDRLIVTLDPPNQGWARTNRFDRTSSVSSIVLDGKHTFTTPEVLDYRTFTTGGNGLMAEFKWDDQEAEAQPGQRYHKIGVGLIERGGEEPNMRSAFFAHCEPYEADCAQDGPDAALFVSKAPLVNGWAFELKRRTYVAGNQLITEATLTNRGERPMKLGEYNHNFVNLDDLPTGSDYRFDFTYEMTPHTGPRGVLRQNGKVFTFSGAPDSPFFLAADSISEADTYGWKLSHAKTPLTIAETVSKRTHRTLLWGTQHVLSAEVYVPIELEPGQSDTWSRTWTFDC